MTDTDTATAVALPLHRASCPYQGEQEAEACEARGDWINAAGWWHAAATVTIGHKRAARYEEAERRAVQKYIDSTRN